jgi:hypothetical protein
MTVATQRNRYLQGPSPSGLVDVLDLILEKGLVIDAYVRISVIGIEILTIEARIVIASVDTYLRFAEAVTRLGLTPAEVHGRPTILRDVAGTVVKDEVWGAAAGARDRVERTVERVGDVLWHHHPAPGVTSTAVDPTVPAPVAAPPAAPTAVTPTMAPPTVAAPQVVDPADPAGGSG